MSRHLEGQIDEKSDGVRTRDCAEAALAEVVCFRLRDSVSHGGLEELAVRVEISIEQRHDAQGKNAVGSEFGDRLVDL
jgi:hypothetical protein